MDRVPSESLNAEPFSNEYRRMLHNVIQFCNQEASERRLVIPLTQYTKRASAVAGVSLSSISRIRKEARGLNEVKFEPPKKRQKKKTIKNVALDILDFDVIRRTVHEFYAIDKELPTVAKLLPVMQEKINFKGKRETLRKVLHEMGFQFQKCQQSNKALLVEQSDVVLSRTRYLRSIRQFREKEKRPIVYLDETWVDGNLTFGKCWQTNDAVEVEQAENVTQRILILCAGGEMGYIPNANLLRKESCSTSGDYHGPFDSDLIEKWAKEKLIPNLPKGAAVVINSAPYYSVQLPDPLCTKQDCMDWLSTNNVPFSSDLRTIELQDLVRRHSPRTESYKFDTILKQHGFVTLRLPPHHCDINAVEYVWAHVKNFVQHHNVMGAIGDMTNLLKLSIDAMNSVTIQDWEKFCSYVVSLENIYWDSDGIVEDLCEPLDVPVNESDDDDDTDVSLDDSEYNDSENNDDSEENDDSEKNGHSEKNEESEENDD